MPVITETIRHMLHPSHVAVIGASSDSAKFGGRVMHFLVKHKYAGRISAVHPSAPEVLGHAAYRDVRDAPRTVDVALLAVPAKDLRASLTACGEAGVRCCVVLTADFAEAGEEGALRERELVATARRYGMRLLGPNCLGYVNPHADLALTSSVALAAGPMPRGAIALISQSGSLMASVISNAQDSGAGFSACVTVGNQADLEICDFIEYFVQDDATRAICVYVEGLKEGGRFLDLADRCRDAGKPLLAVKAGRSDAGVRLAQSHTASLAGSHEVWEAACRQHAVCLLDDPEAMIACAHFLISFGVPRAEGVAAMSPSGGTIAVTADRLAGARVPLAELAPATRDALSKLVPPARPLNPLDIGGLAREQGLPAAVAAQAAYGGDPNVGVLLIVVATTPQLEDKVRAWGKAAIETRTPTAILFTPGALVDGARKALRDLGCPYTNRMDDALRVITTAIEYGRMLHRPARARSQPVRPAMGGVPTGRLTESQAKSLIGRFGIASPDERAAKDAAAAKQAAEAIGYPVVMKPLCRDLVHKSDIGAVKLGLNSPSGVEAAWADIAATIERHGLQASFDGCVVQRMVSGGVELMLGARYDACFGAVVLVGAGGVHVELFDDVRIALAPVDAQHARRLVHELRIGALLRGARGREPVDVEAAVDALVRLSHLAATLGKRLVELDINPLLVQTHGAVALDARATIASPI
jgi:acyl-CoA synthetase (NDP forming)